jgi:hypothetical protein
MLSFVTYSPPAVPCHYRFNGSGAMDVLVVDVQTLDSNAMPVPGTPVSFSLRPSSAGGTLALCTCNPSPTVVSTNATGAATASFDRVGGRGTFVVVVEAVGFGPPIVLDEMTVPFTSPDLNGSCDAPPASATTVADLGVWASGLPPGYQRFSDYDCSGFPVNIVDLGIWAAFGLGVPCTP